MASGLIKSRFIILHRYPYQESSYVVKALGENIGVVSFLVKGAKRKDSPFRVVFDPLVLSEVVYRYSERANLQLPKEAHLLQYFDSLRHDLLTQTTAQVMVELILRLSQQDAHLVDEFPILLSALESVASCQQKNSHVLAKFLYDLAEVLGFHFQLERCVECGVAFELTNPVDVWPARGGAVCGSCLGEYLPHHSAELLQHLQRFMADPQGVHSSISAVELFFLQYLQTHLQTNITVNSFAFLQQMRNTNP